MKIAIMVLGLFASTIVHAETFTANGLIPAIAKTKAKKECEKQIENSFCVQVGKTKWSPKTVIGIWVPNFRATYKNISGQSKVNGPQNPNSHYASADYFKEEFTLSDFSKKFVVDFKSSYTYYTHHYVEYQGTCTKTVTDRGRVCRSIGDCDDIDIDRTVTYTCTKTKLDYTDSDTTHYTGKVDFSFSGDLPRTDLDYSLVVNGYELYLESEGDDSRLAILTHTKSGSSDDLQHKANIKFVKTSRVESLLDRDARFTRKGNKLTITMPTLPSGLTYQPILKIAGEMKSLEKEDYVVTTNGGFTSYEIHLKRAGFEIERGERYRIKLWAFPVSAEGSTLINAGELPKLILKVPVTFLLISASNADLSK